MVKDMDNLYDILQVDDKARDIEIKKAYIKMLRRYPPEKCPEEFKKIREAYEILIEPVLKVEYNAFINYKDKIEDYRKKGNNSLNKKQYRRAIVYYKKILLIEPKLTFAKNKLGLAFFYNKQYEEAVIQFRELIQLNPHNAIFYNNLAYVYKEQKKYELAEELLLKSYDIDNTNEKTVLALGDIYIITEEYDNGIEFLTKCINQSQSDFFQQIMYYLKLLIMYVNTNNIEMVEKNLESVKKIIPNEEKVKEYVIWKLQTIVQQLLQDNNYKLGNKICKKLIEIDNKNEKIIKLSNKFNELINIADSVNLLVQDCRILECLKNPIIYYLHWDNDYEKELNKKREKNIEKIKENIENNFLNVLQSIDILKKEYTILYNYKSELYEEAYKMAEHNKNADDLVENNSEKTATVDEKKEWPILYNVSIDNKKRKAILKRRYYKIMLFCVVMIALLVIILNKFHLFKRI